MKSFILCIAVFVFCIRRVLAGHTYSKSVDVTGAGFYDEFRFDNSADPTHGRVTYVDQQVAQEYNLTYATDDIFIVRADYSTYLMPSDPGRKSVRIISYRQFSTFVAMYLITLRRWGLTGPIRLVIFGSVVFGVSCHVPQGEIDILEGVNNMTPNTATLHTGSSTTFGFHSLLLIDSLVRLRSIGTNCAAYETGNDGCGVQFSDPESFGPSFNYNQGGWYGLNLPSHNDANPRHRYAIERTNSEIRIWFWSRNDGSVPDQIVFSSSHDAVEPQSWGMPAAAWSNDMCDFPEHFGPHNIIINLTFCGDWAGAVYANSGCPDTCENFVNTNPGSFYDAYFDFSAIRIYT
ncbi:family 16 glycosyl hydrolase [Lanmaoa asiatica]|nr:family 16 glycosyl hydrolase [Lanmaoa asiatica]